MLPSVAIIGAGRVGTAVGKLLHIAGYPIAGVVGRSEQSAIKSVNIIGDGIPLASIEQGVKEAHWIFLTVPDDVLGQVAETVGKYMSDRVELLVHTSGVHGASILMRSDTDNIKRLSMHPIRAISDLTHGADRLQGAFWGLEGRADAVEIGKRLVAVLGGHPLLVQEGRKALYHAAAAISSNYVVALIHIGVHLMEKVGVQPEDALKAISNLVIGATSNVLEDGVAGALTGPIERGDVATVLAHLKALESTPRIRDAYHSLAVYTVGVAREKHSGDIDDEIVERLDYLERTLHRIE